MLMYTDMPPKHYFSFTPTAKRRGVLIGKIIAEKNPNLFGKSLEYLPQNLRVDPVEFLPRSGR